MRGGTLRLGVNIDHVATVRNARGSAWPDPLRAAILAETAGADGITAHLREDRRHIRDADMEALAAGIGIPLNFECAATDEMQAILLRLRPHAACLVPERREERTTEGGLDVAGQFEKARAACEILGEVGIRVSLFIDPEIHQLEAAKSAGAPVVEIHTGRFADAEDEAQAARELARIRAAVEKGRALGLAVNAGHGLHYHNVQAVAALPGVEELNIGHAIVARALFSGWENAVREMKRLMLDAAG